MEQWEYLVGTLDVSQLTHYLNKMGELGWELTGTVKVLWRTLYVFKRKKVVVPEFTPAEEQAIQQAVASAIREHTDNVIMRSLTRRMD